MFLWTDLLALIRHPSAALSAIGSGRRAEQAVLALAASLLAPAIVAEVAGFGPYRPPADLGSLPTLTAQGADVYARWVYLHRFMIPMVEIAAGLLLWLIAGLVIHLGARAQKGKGSLAGFLKLVSFVSLVGLVALPISVLKTISDLSSNAKAQLSIGSLAGLAGLVVFAWENWLLIVAARVHYALSTPRAVTSVLGPIGCLLLLAILVLVLAAIAAALVRPGGAL